MSMQEMEGCDVVEDPDGDGLPTDSDKTVETEVKLMCLLST